MPKSKISIFFENLWHNKKVKNSLIWGHLALFQGLVLTGWLLFLAQNQSIFSRLVSMNSMIIIFLSNNAVPRLRPHAEPPRQLRGVLLATKERGSLRGHRVDARHPGPGEEGEGETFKTRGVARSMRPKCRPLLEVSHRPKTYFTTQADGKISPKTRKLGSFCSFINKFYRPKGPEYCPN